MGWKEIEGFLGLPISAAQRWARSGMSITREGRRVEASVEELNRMGRETSEPAGSHCDRVGRLERGTGARLVVGEEAKASTKASTKPRERGVGWRRVEDACRQKMHDLASRE
jgi:hypothetical protein